MPTDPKVMELARHWANHGDRTGRRDEALDAHTLSRALLAAEEAWRKKRDLIADLDREGDRLREELAAERALTRRLRDYVDHLDPCDIRPGPGLCSCGLNDLERMTPAEALRLEQEEKGE